MKQTRQGCTHAPTCTPCMKYWSSVGQWHLAKNKFGGPVSRQKTVSNKNWTQNKADRKQVLFKWSKIQVGLMTQKSEVHSHVKYNRVYISSTVMKLEVLCCHSQLLKSNPLNVGLYWVKLLKAETAKKPSPKILSCVHTKQTPARDFAWNHNDNNKTTTAIKIK